MTELLIVCGYVLSIFASFALACRYMKAYHIRPMEYRLRKLETDTPITEPLPTPRHMKQTRIWYIPVERQVSQVRGQ